MRISPNEPIQTRPQATADQLERENKQAQPNPQSSTNYEDSAERKDGLIHLQDFLKRKRSRKPSPKNERALSLYRRISSGEVEEKGKLFQTLA